MFLMRIGTLGQIWDRSSGNIKAPKLYWTARIFFEPSETSAKNFVYAFIDSVQWHNLHSSVLRGGVLRWWSAFHLHKQHSLWAHPDIWLSETTSTQRRIWAKKHVASHIFSPKLSPLCSSMSMRPRRKLVVMKLVHTSHSVARAEIGRQAGSKTTVGQNLANQWILWI